MNFQQKIWKDLLLMRWIFNKKERMKIYTLLLGALFVSPIQAQTIHDWENHHVLQINREPARAAFIPFSIQKGDCSMSLDGTWKFRWTPVPNERVLNFYQTNFDDKELDGFSCSGKLGSERIWYAYLCFSRLPVQNRSSAGDGRTEN